MNYFTKYKFKYNNKMEIKIYVYCIDYSTVDICKSIKNNNNTLLTRFCY